ncbi:MAG TPA: hypothetical protein VGW10_01700 [Solirubrobacteraceae bacterium]|nr:hypothetical protein [Solirubrobacteraceae bacterium]
MPKPQPATGPEAERATPSPPPTTPAAQLPEPLRDALAVQVFSALTAPVVDGTPTAIAQFIGATVDEVMERLDLLQRHDLAEPVTGSTGPEAAYRATRDALVTDEEWALIPVAGRRRLFAAALEVIEERTWTAMARGGFDADDVHVSWVPADLDRQGYEDVVRVTAEALDRIRDIQAAVVQRRAEGASDGESVKTDLMLLHFRRAGDEAPAADELGLDEERTYELSENVADGLTSEEPDWRGLAVPARQLAALVQQFGATHAT